MNENENITYQSSWDTTKTVLRGKFIAKSAYIKKLENYQITDLTSQGPRQTTRN